MTAAGPILEQNLELLAQRAPALALQLRGLPESGRVVRVAGPRGALSLRDGDVLLGSRYEPEQEGLRLAQEMAAAGGDLQVAVGFALGHHLTAFRALRAVPLIVFEPDPERLRAALALAPLPWLGDSQVRVCCDASELPDLVHPCYTAGLRLATSVHPALLRLDPAAARAAVGWLARAKDSIDTMIATRVARLAGWTRQTVENAPHFLRSPGFGALRGAFRGRPAVIAAAGPSLDKQLEALRRHRAQVLLIAIGPSLGALRRAGLEPDLVHVLESSDVAHQLTRSGPTEALQLVLTPKAHPGLYALPVRSRFVSYTGAEPVASWIARQLGETCIVSAAGSVALSAVHLAEACGADPVLLIGQDLAFENGRVYAGGSCYERIGFEVEGTCFRYTNMEERSEAYAGNLAHMRRLTTQRVVWVEGWHGGRVPTSTSYATFIQYYRSVAEQLARSGTRLVNCTEGGARIPPLEHRAFADELAACAGERFDAGARIRALHDAFTPADPEQLREPLRRVRGALAGLLRRCRRCEKAAERLARGLAHAAGPELAQRLQELQRGQQQIFEALAELPWIDCLVQRELQPLIAAQHRADLADATPAQVVAESQGALALALAGLREAREVSERLESLLLGAPLRLRRRRPLARASLGA